MRRHLRMVHRLVKVREVLDTLNEVCISNRPLQAVKATIDKSKKPQPSVITMKLPAPITDVPGKSTSKPKGKNLATLSNTQKQFHTKTIKKLLKWNNNKQEDTTSSPIPDIPDTLLDTLNPPRQPRQFKHPSRHHFLNPHRQPRQSIARHSYISRHTYPRLVHSRLNWNNR